MVFSAYAWLRIFSHSMLFNSLDFVFFFPLVVCAYFLTPHRYRWVLLLAASYYFYACWKAEYLVLIIASTLIDYGVGLRMGALPTQKARRPYLILSLCSNLGILFAFKYFNFFNESVRAFFDRLNLFYDVPAFDILLPVGISFYTFQTLAYSIDLYRGKQQPERHLGIFALYVSFFPQLVAGPIERSERLLPQFYQKHGFDRQRAVHGLQQMGWGFFKKLVIADRLAIYVNQVYNNPELYSGWAIILATYFFAFQIYCDFSGYSDIAIGAARVLGYDLMQNFRRPYFARSISSFWRRWHISLSTWFRDYLYIPLGGNRVVKWRWYYNLFIVFLVSGLWHGANWTFVVWGALHGLYLIVGLITQERREQVWSWVDRRIGSVGLGYKTAGYFSQINTGWLRSALAVFVTFHLVVLAWVFFRANSLSDALLLLENMFIFEKGIASAAAVTSLGPFELAIAFGAILFMEVVHIVEERGENLSVYLDRTPRWARWSLYYVVGFAILMFGEFSLTEFIYFQF